MNLEIIVVRDPDGDTYLTVFVDGKRYMGELTEFHVDPGAGGAGEGWAEANTEAVQSLSPVAREDALRAIESWSDWS